MTVYVGEGVFDYSFEFSEQTFGNFEKSSMGLRKHIQNSIFAQNKSFISFCKIGIISY